MAQKWYFLPLSLGILAGFSWAFPAQAGTFHQDWYYSMDAIGDGSGGDVYDIQGLALKETSDHLWFAIRGNMPLTGTASETAEDGNIGWGDLFLNSTDLSFEAASQDQALYGIRFSETNDSGVSNLGLYGQVSGKSVAHLNSGFETLGAYYDAGWLRPDTLGTDLSTEAEALDYFGADNPVANVIDQGQYLGAIESLTLDQVTAAGLDFEAFGATFPETIAFRLERDLLPEDSFLASLWLECLNDGVAIRHQSSLTPPVIDQQTVPEPTLISGLVLIGGVMGYRRYRRKISQTG